MLNNGFSIRQYRESDLPMLYQICLETGENGGDATGTIDKDLLGHIFAAPYAYFEPHHCHLLCLGGEVTGYILGTADSDRFNKSCENLWWPALREKYPLPEDVNQSRGANLTRLIHGEIQTPVLLDQYPAHLHIDLLPKAQGQGLGYQLIRLFCKGLIDEGVKGVHLGVSKANTRALSFYLRCGFEVLQDNPEDLIYGMKI
ncbi:MAG: ribosomal protein S18 acetylase RimI-like enzyme [Candidatus Azotimanducaceae bacterium]|jgi:ribosomal protein S18 acetylase RimI-like enzyme